LIIRHNNYFEKMEKNLYFTLQEKEAIIDNFVEEQNMTKQKKLVLLCNKFIKDNKITCAESVYQTDRVIENAYEFIKQICEIAGYHKYDE
jgi:hypothetical protein